MESKEIKEREDRQFSIIVFIAFIANASIALGYFNFQALIGWSLLSYIYYDWSDKE